MLSAESKKESSRAICRPEASGWVLVIMVVAFSILLLTLRSEGPHAPSDTECIILVDLLCIAPTLWFAVWLLRARIEATEEGLRWRGMGPWHSAAWPDVMDYYERFLPKGKKEAVIETPAGKVRFAGGMWKDSPTLRISVEQYAVHARSHAWNVLGLRPEIDWPRAFHYRTQDNKISWVMLFALALLLLAQAIYVNYDKAFTVWSVGALLLSYGPLMLLALLVFLPRLRDTSRRKMQSIAVSMEGLEFRDGPRTVAMAWTDITAYRVIRNRFAYQYMVETMKEQFDFSPTISEFGILSEAIERNAAQAGQNGWQTPDEEEIGGRNARWSSGCEGVGERVFHYRLRTYRAMLWFPTGLSLIIGLLPLVSMAHSNLPMMLIFAGPTLWGWANYFRASIHIGDGLTQYTIFGPRKLAWSEVDDFYLSGEDISKFGNVVGAGKRIRFWIGISDVEELKQEIVRHAVHSRSHIWELRPKKTHKAQTLTRQ